MNFYNLIKFRKLFLILVFLVLITTIIYFIQNLIYLSKPKLNLKKIKDEIESEKKEQIKRTDKIKFSENLRFIKYEKDCGNQIKSCDENEFSFYLYTSARNTLYPKLCIDDKYLSDRLIGRSFNLITIDNITRTLTNIQNYDTYLKDSTNLETQLLSLRPGDKIILFSFDEPPKISKVAKLLINELGSIHIQNVQFRTVWFLISEKQINGYSPFEEIHLPEKQGQYGLPHNVHLCIPFQIKSEFVKVDQSLFGNKDRVEFCKQSKDKWKGFCDDNVVNDGLLMNEISFTNSIPTTNNPLQATPILIFSNPFENDLFSLTLETLFRQAAIIPKNVLVFYYQDASNELRNLTKLFPFKSFKIDQTTNFFIQVQKQIEQEFPAKNQFILIFNNLILMADFLNYFSQLISILTVPNSEISFISAWNENCLDNMCTDEKLVMRIKGNKLSFKHALAIKFDEQFFSLLEKLILLNNFNDQSINFDELDHDGLVPDFPRIIPSKEVSNLFLNKKKSLFENFKINQIESLLSVESYRKSLMEFEANSLKLKDEKSLIYYLDNQNNSTSVNITIYTNSTTFDQICIIFNLKYCNCNYHIKEMGDILRFNLNEHLSVLLIKN